MNNILTVKCGGSIINDLSDTFFESLNELKSRGYSLVFVHGGGPDINEMLSKEGIEPVFINGLRKTSAEVLGIAELILSGKTNRSLVEKLESHGIPAIGLNGSDCGIFQAELIDEAALGAVGEVKSVNTGVLNSLLEKGITPVLTPISSTGPGKKANVNADMAAGAAAKAMNSKMCLFVTDVKGVLIEKKIQKSLTKTETESYIRNGTIYGGMIPKVKTALAVLDQGVNDVMIVSGTERFFKDGEFIGTKFVKEEGY
ncbi:acetylglutamate kinase [Peribacillus saganii]|uniref:Acetylglutamate kinase n=1 Tax=Peribacillus saganii TaxID=2303992 RepID=A0A372LLW0_9BACI|nr:acetylglutamate kinase [Peribacillus saganii]RFU68045.1 acetylglutamate kinase [Peribacillus saganii]